VTAIHDALKLAADTRHPRRQAGLLGAYKCLALLLFQAQFQARNLRIRLAERADPN